MIQIHGESKTDKNGDCIIELPIDFKNIRDINKDYFFSYDIYNCADDNENNTYLNVIKKDNNKITIKGSNLTTFHYSIIAYQREINNLYPQKDITIEKGKDIIVNKLKWKER